MVWLVVLPGLAGVDDERGDSFAVGPDVVSEVVADVGRAKRVLAAAEEAQQREPDDAAQPHVALAARRRLVFAY